MKILLCNIRFPLIKMIFTHASLEDKSMQKHLYWGPYSSTCHILKSFSFFYKHFIDLLYILGAGGSEIRKKQPLILWGIRSWLPLSLHRKAGRGLWHLLSALHLTQGDIKAERILDTYARTRKSRTSESCSWICPESPALLTEDAGGQNGKSTV